MKPDSFKVVAIDGGAASGKSTTARALSARHHFLHVDTGQHYRALTAHLLNAQVPAETRAVNAAIDGLDLTTSVQGQEAIMRIDGQVVETLSLRTAEVNASVSAYAALPPVREKLLPYQRAQIEVAQKAGFRGIAMEGRDIGSVIFPDADLRVFLEADPRTRTERRAQEGWKDTVVERDTADSRRTLAPLTCTPGAYRIDTSTLSVDQVIERIGSLLEVEPLAPTS